MSLSSAQTWLWFPGPAHKITMGQHFKTNVTGAVSIKDGRLPRPMFFSSLYLNMWILLCLIQIYHRVVHPPLHASVLLNCELHVCITTGSPHLWNTAAIKQALLPLWYKLTLDTKCVLPQQSPCVDWTHQLCLCCHYQCELLKVRASHLLGRNQ